MNSEIIKSKCSLLSSSKGESASILMKELGIMIQSAKSLELKEFSSVCESFFESASPSRKASIVYLLTLTKKFDLVKKFSENEDFRVRESLAKGLSRVGDTSVIDFIDDWLVVEDSFRVKKWLLIALKNIGSERSVCLLKNYEPEPELFLEHKKLLLGSESPKDIPLDIVSKLIVRTVSGFENLWLNSHNFSGKILGDGFILLNEEFSLEDFINFRDLFEVGFFLGDFNELKKSSKLFGGFSFNILYSNNVSKEKSLLNKASFILSENNLFVHPKSLFSLKVFTNEKFGLFFSSFNKDYKDFLPASINSVVASCLSLLEPNAINKVLDPCCGAGTLLIEHNKRYSFSECFGFDKSFDALNLAKRNASANHCKIIFKKNDLIKDSFPENFFDRIICNPPFDKRVKLDNKSGFYRSLLKKSFKSLSSGGVLIVYTVQKKLLMNSFDSLEQGFFKNRFVFVKEIKLFLPKIQPSVFIFKKLF